MWKEEKTKSIGKNSKNFPSEEILNKFVKKEKIQCGLAKVVFFRWKYPHVCSYFAGVSRKYLKISRLPPACKQHSALDFSLKGVGNIVEIKKNL